LLTCLRAAGTRAGLVASLGEMTDRHLDHARRDPSARPQCRSRPAGSERHRQPARPLADRPGSSDIRSESCAARRLTLWCRDRIRCGGLVWCAAARQPADAFTADAHRYEVTPRPLLPGEPRSCPAA